MKPVWPSWIPPPIPTRRPDGHVEQQIINANVNDRITTILDVQPGDNFDGDGASNLASFSRGPCHRLGLGLRVAGRGIRWCQCGIQWHSRCRQDVHHLQDD